MLVKTKFFGEIEMDEKEIINFEDGLPGFTTLHRFAMIHQEEAPVFNYMQSVEDAGVCFVVVPPSALVGDYSIDISEDAVKKLGIENESDVLLYAILTIPENIRDMTANLKAPVVINIHNQEAMQVILGDDRYDIRHKIVKEADASC